MKRKFFIKLFCTVFALSFVAMACQPTKDSSQKQSMRNSQMRGSQFRDNTQDKESSTSRMPMKKKYDDGSCCPESDCCPKSDCEWCKPRCDDTDKPTGNYAPRQPMKKECPECPESDCCDPCDDCGCDDCCDPCDDCGCDDCCDPCDSCCSSCGPNGRKYTRNELFGRDAELKEQNRHDSRRYSEK